MSFGVTEGKTKKMTMPLSDEDLWVTFRGGDDSAFTLLYFRYADRLYSYLKLLLGSGSQRYNIEDVFQETWIRVYREKEKFEIREEGTFSGWLFRIAHNYAITLLRRPHYVSSFNEMSDDKFLYNYTSTKAEDTLNDEKSAEEVITLLRKVVEELPLAMKEVYLLSEFERMNMDQISEALGISKANAKVRLFRARRIVRERMIAILGIDKTFADRSDGQDNDV